MDRSASERKSKQATPQSQAQPGTPTRSASVFKLPIVPLGDATATTPNNANKKRKAQDKSKTPRAAADAVVVPPISTPDNSMKKARSTVGTTPLVTSMRDATRVFATPTPTNTPLKPSLSSAFDFEPSVGVPSFLLSDHKVVVPESPRHVRASEMIEHAFTNHNDAVEFMPDAPVAICMSLQLRSAFRQQEYCGLTHVVMLTGIPPSDAKSPIVYHHVPIDALTSENQLQFLEALFTCVEFVDEVKARGGKCGVACRNGRLLSAAVVAAWIMADTECSFEDAYARLVAYKPDVALTKEAVVLLRFFEWHRVTLGVRSMPRDLRRYFEGWSQTADGRAALELDGNAHAAVEALREQLAQESQLRVEAEKQSKKARKQIDELKQTTRIIVSETESMLQQQRVMESASIENDTLRARVIELEQRNTEQKREHMQSLQTLLHETERLEEAVTELQAKLDAKSAELAEAQAEIDMLTDEFAAAADTTTTTTAAAPVKDTRPPSDAWSTFDVSKGAFKKLDK